jgi:cholesterol oxidase
MLGAKGNAFEVHADRLAREIAEEAGRGEHYELTRVGIFMGEPGKEVPDPYFDGEGPPRVGCTQCGACLTGCRVGAKNSTDKNYLYFAEKLGCTILAETEVNAVRTRPEGGYRVETTSSTSEGGDAVFTADQVVFSGGVMGTVPLLLRMKEDPNGLPRLSERVGDFVRTNSEALINVVSSRRDVDYSKGIALSSIVHMDEHSHFETGRYGAGSDLFKALTIPYVAGGNFFVRLFRLFAILVRYPRRWWGVMRADYARQTTIFIYMRALEETMRLRLGRGLFTGFKPGVVSELDAGSEGPKAQMDEADELVWKLAHKMDGLPTTLINGLFHSAASTAHVLGGACMGDSIETGVIDDEHRVYGYEGLYVVDGAAVSANPGVNPSLTITALAERAMSFIPPKQREPLTA